MSRWLSPLIARPFFLFPVFIAVLGTLAAVAVVGCGSSDPLEAIRKQQAKGDFQGTLEPLRELLAERRADAETNFLYGRALFQTGQAGLAEWSLLKAMEDPEWLVPAGTQLAVAALSGRNYPLAIEATGRILEVEPDNVAILLMRANAYAHSKLNNEEALADVDRILELDPDNADALEPRILALLALDRIEEAGQAIQELGERIDETELGPDKKAWHCATSAIFAEERGDIELAEKRWADCLERYPANRNVVKSSLEFYDSRREADRSLEILRRALAADPTSRDYRVVLAQRLRFVGQAEESERLLREATESEDPRRAAAAWFDLAKHYQELGDYAAAAEAVERALGPGIQAVAAQNPQMLLEYADALVLAGEYDKALAVARDMVVAPHRAVVRARVAQEQGRPAEALEHFAEAFRLWPDNPWARYYAALAAEALGDFEQAIESYRYAMRIDPNATDARNRVTRLLLAAGRPADAIRSLMSLVNRAPLDTEGELLALRLRARLGQTGAVPNILERLASTHPDQLGRGVAAAAQGVREGAGPAEAVRWIRGLQNLDLEDPSYAEVLRSLVRFSHEAGEADEGEQAGDVKLTVRAALRAHPDAAEFHEIEGLRLELNGAPAGEARKAYERALELDPENGRALAGLGRLARQGEPEQALSLFDRALAADPDDVDSGLAAVRLLIAGGRGEEAEERLNRLLERHPYHAGVALELAELQVEQGAVTDHTLGLVHRAVRFGGGPDALELLSRVYEERNQPERASRAAERARALREGRASARGGEQVPAQAPGEPGD